MEKLKQKLYQGRMKPYVRKQEQQLPFFTTGTKLASQTLKSLIENMILSKFTRHGLQQSISIQW